MGTLTWGQPFPQCSKWTPRCRPIIQHTAIETAKQADQKVYLISKIMKYLTIDDALKAYKTYLRAILEYCSASVSIIP